MTAEQTVLITGASGFIGSRLCRHFVGEAKVVCVEGPSGSRSKMPAEYESVRADITDRRQLTAICERYRPDIIIHCAGIAHQSLGSSVAADAYYRVNRDASVSLAGIAADINPDLYFIYLSSVSVYGEDSSGRRKDESCECLPFTPYARSKLGGESGLIEMWESGALSRLDILRLAPVYSREWSLNFEKRVFGPLKLCYVRFGSGDQKMSALALPNLINFIQYRIVNQSLGNFCQTFNVTDGQNYSFNEIIRVFKRSEQHPDRLTVWIPLGLVWFGTKLLTRLFKGKKRWALSCYDKLAGSIVFDNKKMLETGYIPTCNLETTFK